MGEKTTYKIKLENGRVVGPLPLDKVAKLIQKGVILGSEPVKKYPDGHWATLQSHSELLKVLVAHLKGESLDQFVAETEKTVQAPEGSTVVLSQEEVSEKEESLKEIEIKSSNGDSISLPKAQTEESPVEQDSDDRTEMIPTSANEAVETPQDDRTEAELPALKEENSRIVSVPSVISEAKTVVVDRESLGIPTKPGKKSEPKEKKKPPLAWTVFKVLVVGTALGIVISDYFEEEPASQEQLARPKILRARVPDLGNKEPNVELSKKYYDLGVKEWVKDHVIGYRRAESFFHESIKHDPSNIKALALLASTYLNLIDSSNKDENYFNVILKLIELAKSKDVNLAEVVIAEVELYTTLGKADAAQDLIVRFTKSNQNFGLELFYYLAWVLYHRGEYSDAAKYLSQIPDGKAFSPKVYYLKGKLAEHFSEWNAALASYKKAVDLQSNHALSRVRMAYVQFQLGKLEDAEKSVTPVLSAGELLAPQDLASAFALDASIKEKKNQIEAAIGSIRKAVTLNPDHRDYRLQFYTLRLKAGESAASLRDKARVFFFLGEGEKHYREGKYQEALTEFMQARQADLKAVLPLIRLGETNLKLRDIASARMGFQKATELAPNQLDVWVKYIGALIEGFDYQEAQRAIAKAKELTHQQSIIDKITGDLLSKQGAHAEAQAYYRRAMSREVIDSEVYLSYGKSLIQTRNFKEAPFFFALSLRLDPLNTEAIIGTARALAGGDTIERGIRYLESTQAKMGRSQSELLTAIAELQIQAGDLDLARKNLEQAIELRADYGEPWKWIAVIHIKRFGLEKKALNKALEAYQAYSDRNQADPQGYLERYKIFIQQKEYEKASQELEKIYSVFPNYPDLHYFKGTLYLAMGNYKTATEEFEKETSLHPGNSQAYIGLGKARIELGQKQEALTAFSTAMQLSPQNSEPKHLAGYTNYLLKNFPAAIALYRAAIANDPGNSLIYKRMGQAQLESGDGRAAKDAFKKYLELEPDAPDRSQYSRYL